MIARSIKSRRTLMRSVLAATAMVALTGCGALHPGSAAVVGPTTISHKQVDDVAVALCSANIKGAEAQGQEAPVLASRGARQGAMQILLESELSLLFGAELGVEPNQQQVSQALAQSEQGIAMLPESEREAFSNALEGYASGQLILGQVGRQALEQQGETEVTDEQAVAEGTRLRGEFVQTLDVEIDPRYGSFQDDTLRIGGTALSVAESEGARAGEQAEPDAAFVAALPASQRCS